MVNLPDHPDIRRAELYGYGERSHSSTYECPICGAELYPHEEVYKDVYGVVGCEFCFDEDEWDMNEIIMCDAEDVYG